MATFINTSLTAPSVTKDTFTFNNDSNYFVNATVGDISRNTITFGDGSRDQVTAAGDISQNTITFGNGGDDNVRALGISKSIITFGNGAFDEVIAGGSIDHNTITAPRISLSSSAAAAATTRLPSAMAAEIRWWSTATAATTRSPSAMAHVTCSPPEASITTQSS